MLFFLSKTFYSFFKNVKNWCDMDSFIKHRRKETIQCLKNFQFLFSFQYIVIDTLRMLFIFIEEIYVV